MPFRGQAAAGFACIPGYYRPGQQGGNEEGLLGLAFDPRYRDNGYFTCTTPPPAPPLGGSRFRVDQNNDDVAARGSEASILEVEQPFSNHNGGQLAFGPDGYLYIGLGMGVAPVTLKATGQNLGTLLGSICVSTSVATGHRGYRIPVDNPFAGAAAPGRDLGVRAAEPLALFL